MREQEGGRERERLGWGGVGGERILLWQCSSLYTR